MSNRLNDLYADYVSDPTRLEQLLLAVNPYARKIARSKKHPSPEDAAQDITVKVWQSLSRFTGKDGFAAWVRTIAFRYLVDEHRGRQRQPDIAGSIDDEDYVEQPITEYPLPSRVFAGLPYEIRRIATMLATGHTMREIAVELGCSERTIKRMIERFGATLKSA